MERIATGYTLIEGPTWDAERGLLFSDVKNGGVYCLKSDASVELVVPHRRGIGGIALHERGGVIVGGRNIAYKGTDVAGTQVLLPQDCVPDIIGFNDLTTDNQGRIYVGSLGASPFGGEAGHKSGFLHLIDLDGSSQVLADDIKLTNGLGFSPDGKTLYHSDSRKHMVGCYAVNEDGTVGPRQQFAQIGRGIPDGLAVAEDGSVWVAIARGDAVVVYNPDGSERERIETPLHMPTSVCFGGTDLKDLYIVTGSEGTGREDGGSIFVIRTDIAGSPVAPARVQLVGA